MEPPKVRFSTKIYHPNVKFDTGEISMHILCCKWCPVLRIEHVCSGLMALIIDPQPEDCLEPEIAKLFKTDRIQFNENARLNTQKYAM